MPASGANPAPFRIGMDMSNDDRLAIRALLENEVRALDEQLAVQPDPVELDQSRVGRLSRIDALQQQSMAAGLRERMLRQRERVLAAISRVDDGTFGECCRCGETIDPQRLQADRSTPFCADCQQELDRNRRRT
jgi:DnaK suppressor protein